MIAPNYKQKQFIIPKSGKFRGVPCQGAAFNEND